MKRYKHNLSNYRITTVDPGKLLPICCYPVLPGDTFQHRVNLFIRTTSLNAPVMHPLLVRVHSFFVPNRLVWDETGGSETDFKAFITGGSDGTKTPTHPYYAAGTITASDLMHHIAVPVGAHSPAVNYNALPLRAYNLIWNEYYRDQDLETELTIDKTDGQDTTSNTTMQSVCWPKDYYTAARPWETKGTAVTIPLGTTADITGTGEPTFDYSNQTNQRVFTDAGGRDLQMGATGSGSDALEWNDPQLQADLSSATGIDVNDLRLYLALQRYQEARAQFGSRYVEYIRYAFNGVRSSDARLQNPEYLGGGRQTLGFGTVFATADSGTYNPGDMLGSGLVAMRTNRYRRFFEEHGWVLTLLSVVPKPVYADATHKEFFKTTKEEYFQKELQHLGDQEITNKEVRSLHATPDGTFGYQRRYDEYRYIPSRVCGDFTGASMDHWHMARMFSSDPALNSTFVSANPTDRIFQSTATDNLLILANNSIQARRVVKRNPMARTF